MEGIIETPFRASLPRAQAAAATASVWPGYIAASCVTALAYALHYAPVAPFAIGEGAQLRRPISAAILAILLGVLVRNVLPLMGVEVGKAAAAGCKRIVRVVLPLTIVLAGAGLDVTRLAAVGAGSLLLVLVCVTVATVTAVWCGRWLGVGRGTSVLIGAGTAICGNSAIVAVAPMVQAKDEDLVLSIATVNLCGLAAMLLLPPIGSLMGMSEDSFGIWAGATIHSVPQAVAAGFAFSDGSGAVATLVKLVRVALLAPLVFLLAVLHARRVAQEAVILDDGSFGDTSAERDWRSRAPSLALRYSKLVPWFVWGFAIMAALVSLGLLPTLTFGAESLPGRLGDGEAVSVSLAKMLSEAGTLMLTLAMAAIGLELDLHLLMRTGVRAVVTGVVATVALVLVCLGLMQVL